MGNSESSVDLKGPEANFIQSQVNGNCVMIFSKTTCPYCSATKDVFKKLGVQASVVELNKRQDGDTLQDILAAMTGARTVPRVFVNGKCIGGNSETQALFKSGQLQQMVQNCGT